MWLGDSDTCASAQTYLPWLFRYSDMNVDSGILMQKGKLSLGVPKSHNSVPG